jgi:hypothetical protein
MTANRLNPAWATTSKRKPPSRSTARSTRPHISSRSAQAARSSSSPNSKGDRTPAERAGEAASDGPAAKPRPSAGRGGSDGRFAAGRAVAVRTGAEIPRVDRAMGWGVPAPSLFRVRPAAAKRGHCDHGRAAVGEVGGEVARQGEAGAVPRPDDDVGRAAAWAEAGDRSFWKSRLRNRRYS